MSVQLPLNWLFDEFDAIVQRSRDGQRGTVVLYKCKKCEVPVFEHKSRARRHATLQRHRRYFPTDISDTGALSESDAKIHSPRRSSSAPPSSPRRPTSSHSRTPGHIAPLSGVHRANRDTFTGGRSAEDPVYHAGLDSESDTSESEVFNVGLGHGQDTFDAVHDSLPEDLPWSDEDGSATPTDTCSSETSESELGSDADSETDPGETSSDPASSARTAREQRKRGRCTPYPNMTWCILDIMLNLPRHPISDELLKIFLWALKMLGVKHVPSLKALRKFQAKLRGSGLFKKDRTVISVVGNHFTQNSILKSIMLDMANPEVRRHLVFYPEEPVNGSSELRHSWKWFQGLPDAKLTPMWAYRGVHFYIGEAAELVNGDVVIPLRWFVREGAMHMFYYRAQMSEDGRYEVDASKRLRGPASVLQKNLPQLLQSGRRLNFFYNTAQAASTACAMPHNLNKWRIKAAGRPCYAYFILLGGDDVSGNRSKTWNKHWCFYFCAAGLPLACLNQEYFVHYVSTSQHAGPVEQVAAITEELRSVEDTGLVCIDVAPEGGGTPGECLMLPNLFVGTGDGPWQSELCSHSGDNKPCRFCDVGGSVKERSSDEGFLAIMRTGTQREPNKTVEQIKKDLSLATKPRKGAEIERNQQQTGVVDSLAQRVIEELVQKGKSLFEEKDEAGKRVHSNVAIEVQLCALQGERFKAGDFLNPLLSDQAFDPHLDTAVGRLHLVLLGFTKYFWSASLPVGGGKKLSAKEKEIVERTEAILRSLNQDGIGKHSLRPEYVIQFRGSLVGRHLHSIAQLAVFLFAHTVERILHNVWIHLSRLCALLYVQVIKDMAEHKSLLSAAIEHFYDSVCQYNPTWVMYKNKFHHLAHTPQMIEHFGVLGLVAEDRFEKFHGLWRHSSIFSNHHAASRDSALHFNSLDATKHILSGGLFQWEGQVIQAGPSVLHILADNPHLHERLGLHTVRTRQAGYVRLKQTNLPEMWGSLYGHDQPGLEDIWPISTRRKESDFFKEAQWLITVRGDTCRPGAFVWSTSSQHVGIVRVLHIYSRASISGSRTQAPETVVLVDIFELTGRHPTFDCPSLLKCHQSLMLPSELRFVVNVQHDCIRGKCAPTALVAEVQERTETSRQKPTLEHSEDIHFVLNIFILHHFDELTTLIPPEFLRPKEARDEMSRRELRLAAAKVLRQQIQTQETARGAVRQARSEVNAHAKGTNNVHTPRTYIASGSRQIGSLTGATGQGESTATINPSPMPQRNSPEPERRATSNGRKRGAEHSEEVTRPPAVVTTPSPSMSQLMDMSAGSRKRPKVSEKERRGGEGDKQHSVEDR